MNRSSAPEAVAATTRQVLTDILGLPADSPALHDGANLFELGLDSLGVVRLVVDLEAAFDIQLPAEALRAEQFERYDRLMACIQEQVAEKPA